MAESKCFEMHHVSPSWFGDEFREAFAHIPHFPTVSKYSSLCVFTPVKKKCSSSEMRFMTASERSSPVEIHPRSFRLSFDLRKECFQ